MYSLALHAVIDPPWRAMEPIRVGPVPSGLPTPAMFLLVECDGRPHTRVDIYAEYHAGPFIDLIVWGEFVVLGWNDVVHLIDPAARTASSIPCDGYFGYLHPVGDRLLIASASELIHLGPHGEELWRRGGLGIDGVVIEGIVDGIVEGSGEWDPPGGWHPFRVLLATGESPRDETMPGEAQPPVKGG